MEHGSKEHKALRKSMKMDEKAEQMGMDKSEMDHPAMREQMKACGMMGGGMMGGKSGGKQKSGY